MFLLIIFIDKNHFQKGKYRTTYFKRPFEFQNFSEILYCGMTSIRNKNLGVFYRMLIHKSHFKKQKYGQSLFKKHSKFQSFDEIFYCHMTRLSKASLTVFIQC